MRSKLLMMGSLLPSSERNINQPFWFLSNKDYHVDVHDFEIPGSRNICHHFQSKRDLILFDKESNCAWLNGYAHPMLLKIYECCFTNRSDRKTGGAVQSLSNT
ncbi:hypothetical protein TNCV_2012571 [Trichonephila clavipes]|nr:hypothetical protein TNCV_2012571 [Trichonephila clavipes]